jgi:hypothetical protein
VMTPQRTHHWKYIRLRTAASQQHPERPVFKVRRARVVQVPAPDDGIRAPAAGEAVPALEQSSCLAQQHLHGGDVTEHLCLFLFVASSRLTSVVPSAKRG